MKNKYFLLAALAIAVVFTAGCTAQEPIYGKTSTTLPPAYTAAVDPCSSPTSVTPTAELKAFENKDTEFTFSYPAVWDTDENWGYIVLFGDPKFSSEEEGKPILSISSHTAMGTSSETKTLPKYTGYWLDFIENRSKEVVEGLKICSTTLGGEKAHRLVYDLYIESGRPAITQTEVYAVKNDKIYKITYSSNKETFTKHLPDFEAMISSFQMK